ncbi:hypothetical protein UJ101_02481 [Flavobacteriaceae bacterium UJ101]|nr:hypothetical protein UJ101_02481 [Flavobacteriaceae bacterium UJ101]
MEASVRLFTSERETKKGFPIKVEVNHLGKIKRKTIGHSKKEDWNDLENLPLKSHPSYRILYTYILNLKSKIHEVSLMNLSIESTMNYILRDNKTSTFVEFVELRISELEKQGKLGNKKVYEKALKEWNKIIGDVEFSEINHSLLTKFKNAKKNQLYKDKNGEVIRVGVKNRTIHTYFRTYKACYNEAVNRGLIDDKRPFKNITKDIPYSATANRKKYLLKKDWKKIEEIQLTDYLSQSRDLFLLQFYLGGHDLMDIYYLKKKDIQSGRVYLIRHKLGERAKIIDVKLTDKAKIIIDRYKCDDDKNEFLFPWPVRYDKKKNKQSLQENRHLAYTTFSVNHRRDLNIIKDRIEGFQVHPVDGPMGQKIARHSFATIGKRLFIMEDILREIMGHERVGDIDTIYKDKYPEKIRDDAQIKITDTSNQDDELYD